MALLYIIIFGWFLTVLKKNQERTSSARTSTDNNTTNSSPEIVLENVTNIVEIVQDNNDDVDVLSQLPDNTNNDCSVNLDFDTNNDSEERVLDGGIVIERARDGNDVQEDEHELTSLFAESEVSQQFFLCGFIRFPFFVFFFFF